MKKKFTISKVYKIPIPGIAFSNQQVGLTIEYEPENEKEFDVNEANDEFNRMINIIKEEEPSWIHQLTLKTREEQNESNH